MGGGVSFPRETLVRDKVVIVTGANTGIGYETAKWIAMLGAKVILACRTESKALQAIEQMNREFTEEKSKGTNGIVQDSSLDVTFMQVDLSSLKSTMKFIQEVKTSGRKLHTLICNAGLLATGLETTEDGHEAMLQVNYLSQFLIIVHLLPLMEQSGSDDCRVVLVSSLAHDLFAAPFNEKRLRPNFFNRDGYDFMQQYGSTKLYQVMQMYYMNRRLTDSNVSVLSTHPGLIKSDLYRNIAGSNRNCCYVCCYSCIVSRTGKSTFQGAETEIVAAIDPKYKGSRDIYFSDCKPKQSSRQSRNVELQETLLMVTLELVKDYIPEDILKRWTTN